MRMNIHWLIVLFFIFELLIKLFGERQNKTYSPKFSKIKGCFKDSLHCIRHHCISYNQVGEKLFRILTTTKAEAFSFFTGGKIIPGSILLASSSASSISRINWLWIWEDISSDPSWMRSVICSFFRLLLLPLSLLMSWLGLPSKPEIAWVWHMCSACFQIARIANWIEKASRYLSYLICAKKKHEKKLRNSWWHGDNRQCEVWLPFHELVLQLLLHIFSGKWS